MKKMKLFGVTVIFFICFGGKIFPHVGLKFPIGGETFQSGQQVTIEWQVLIYHGASDWDLSFSSNGGLTWESIQSNISESQHLYDWTVPNISSNTCKIKVVQDNQSSVDYEAISDNFTIDGSTDVKELPVKIENFVLYPAYPNPFNPTTKVSYSLPVQSRITLKIYDMLGNEVTTLVDGTEPEGSYEFVLNASGWTSGVYFYKLQAVTTGLDSRGTFVQTKKLILLK